jgi:cell division protein FtsN
VSKKSQQAFRDGGGNGRAPLPAWAWLVIGVLLGLVLSGIALYRDWLPALRQSDGPQPNPQATAQGAGEAGVAPEPVAPQAPVETKPKYDFYSVLPEMEVVIPDAEIKAQAAAQPPPAATDSTTTAAAGERLFLQAASFKNSPDADAMKAKLALLGMRAAVVSVTINDSTWYRVRVGPFATARELDEAKRGLEGNGIQAIALREKR